MTKPEDRWTAHWPFKPDYLHDILFRFKRIYLRGRQHQVVLLRYFGLTPARLEALRLVLAGHKTQPALRRALGIARSTASRMLIAMEARGLVVRTARATSRARKSIALAPGLEERITDLLAKLHVVYGAAIAELVGRRPLLANAHLDRVTRVQEELDSIARCLGDRARHQPLTLYEYWDY